MEYFLESCCTSVPEVLLAQSHGASRIELCVDLDAGGVMPPRKLIEDVMNIATVPVNVLVRPRGGDFCYSGAEVSQMMSDIQLCRDLKVNGVVIGALDVAGDVDVPVMQRLIEAAGPMKKTFHRAFDCCRDPFTALQDIIALGFDTLLTSGHSEDAYQGRFLIAELVRKAGDALTVMPGCGVRSGNIDEIRRITRATQFHASKSFWKEK